MNALLSRDLPLYIRYSLSDYHTFKWLYSFLHHTLNVSEMVGWFYNPYTINKYDPDLKMD